MHNQSAAPLENPEQPAHIGRTKVGTVPLSLSTCPHHGDWRDIEGDGFGLAAFHRTCTFMANSGAKHIHAGMTKANGLNEDRWLQMGRDAWEFCNHMQACPIPHVASENPVMIGYAQLMIGKPSQTVQPWLFGHEPDGPDNCKKATCWWLRNLLSSKRTGTLEGSTARDEVFRMAPTADADERGMARSSFHPGMASAIAHQWGAYLDESRAAA